MSPTLTAFLLQNGSTLLPVVLTLGFGSMVYTAAKLAFTARRRY